ncbi:MAG TPA: NAD-dependent epimerase/dehydratase family protein [Opitutaceae bacterium]|nr:NAD-dependent epimerase/dehydratase family protein [Opitutaceae bacterium]
MKVLVTGAAGFIGYHVARRLVETKKCEVLGVDNLGDYYEVALKRARLAELANIAERVEPTAGARIGAQGFETFRFLQLDFAEAEKFAALVAHFKPDYLVHLGAQPGVRHSMENPAAYTHSNLAGFASVLEACRRTPPKHLVFASSSSVYGAGATPPFREDDNTDQPISFYGATKKANELMAHSYALNHRLNLTGLRFFTVYGPWGRPDMAPTLFARAICEGKTLKLFNHGKNLRDFTYIDDIVDGVVKVLLYPPAGQSGAPPATATTRAAGLVDPKKTAGANQPLRLFNLGHHRPVETVLFVKMLEQLLGKPAKIELLPPQPGDMFETCADLTRVQAEIGFTPKVSLEAGLKQFVEWFRRYYRL